MKQDIALKNAGIMCYYSFRKLNLTALGRFPVAIFRNWRQGSVPMSPVKMKKLRQGSVPLPQVFSVLIILNM
jgi:hypothetical protein